MGSIGAKNTSTRELTDTEMEAALTAEFKRVDDIIDKFMSGRADTFDQIEGADDLVSYPIEKHSLQDIIKTYITWDFNDNLSKYGNGFEFWDEDQVIDILWKDGTSDRIGPDWWPSDKKIPTSKIDSVIVNGGWGVAFGGKHVDMYNMRERLPYLSEGRRYNGYRNIKERYNDENDIRFDFRTRLGVK